MTITAEYSPFKERDTRKLLSETKFFEGYSRFNTTQGRFETWDEAVGRVMDMHRGFFADKIATIPKLGEYIDDVETAYAEKLILGAQRSLQYGGEQILKHHMRMYNCLEKNTKFVTINGIKTFNDFIDGDETKVLTHTGKWQKAKIKSYGIQKLNKITFTKGSNEKVIMATGNHRWILHDGSSTTQLKIGDRLYKEPRTFSEFIWEDSSPIEQLYWCYGYVYGDGTVNNNHSMVRLCKKDIGLEQRFLSMGFKSSSSTSLEGDIMVYTGTYIKTLPDLEKDSPELIRAFVSGYMAADGVRNYQPNGKQYEGIQSSDPQSIDFIRKAFPIAGVHIISEKDYTGQITNYGTRPYTIRFITCDDSGSKYNSGWKVRNIEEYKEDVVWCLEVENDASFILDGGIVTGNCTSSYADRPSFFGEYFYILLCGCGAGFSVQKHHIAKLPMIRPRTKQPKTHTITDDIEGWATALDVLLSSFFIGGGKYPEFEGRRVFFEYHKIREKGAPISGGFKAPGPEPLKKALNKIEELLNKIAENGILRAIDIYDILMHAADAVISGGVRRAATICLFSKDDEEMLKAKTGNWFTDNPQRARSNNSVVFKRDEVTLEEFLSIMKYVKEFGEPGFVFVSSLEHCFNPCVEIGMFPQTETGISGWQGCNLVEGNGSKCQSKEDFFRLCKMGAILATLQAAYTDFKFVGQETKDIFDREALLGVSLTGWMNSPDILFDEKVLQEGARIVKETNREVAKMIGINPAARTTCVKPAGNASVLLGTASGIHPEHSKRYIRNIQISKSQEVSDIIKKFNPYMVEESVWSSLKTDNVISFPIIAPKNSIYKADLSGTEFLDKVKLVQQNWVEYGTDESLCVDPTVRHNVSNTVSVRDGEWDEVATYIYNNRVYFTGVSLIGESGDKDYFQAPNIEVMSPREMVRKYGEAALFASGLITDASNGFNNLWEATRIAIDNHDESSQELKDIRSDWIRRFRKFADNFFNGDLKKTSYCLKDVYILYKWMKIQINLKDFNMEEHLKIAKNIDVDTMGAVACAAGACEI
jgi:ribonucleoside-diphosphate reductase alpha chain